MLFLINMELKDIIKSIKRKRARLKSGYVWVPYVISSTTPIVIDSKMKDIKIDPKKFGYLEYKENQRRI
jgi:hypothetical protein